MLEGFQTRLLERRFVAALMQRQQLALGVARHIEYRMRQKVQSQRALCQYQTDGVHQEGHVVVDHLDDGMRRGITVVAQRGVEYPHQRPAAPLLRELAVQQRHDGEFRCRPTGEVFGFDVGVIRRKIDPRARAAQ